MGNVCYNIEERYLQEMEELLKERDNQPPEGGIDDVLREYSDKKSAQTELVTGARKDLAGKLRFDLIPPEVDRSLAEVYTLGAAKYSDRNWEKGIPFTVIIASLKRHLNEFELGTLVNHKDGDLLHVEHVLWWAAALVTFSKRTRVDLNDLPAYSEQK